MPPKRKIVRTGCLTCKIRKIKCDEGKPACVKCVSTGRKCDGYRPTPERAPVVTQQPMELGKLLGLAQTNAIITSLRSNLPGDTKERRALHFFINCTAPGLTGNFNSSFWEHTILQACISEPALRHIAVAIGSTHEMLSTKSRAAQNIKPGDRYTISLYALQQYNKSIRQLNRLSSSKEQKPEILLLSCVLFICFDSLRGHYDIAAHHLEAGLNILNQWKTGNLSPLNDPYLFQRFLVPVFTALGIQAGLFVTNRGVTGSLWYHLRGINDDDNRNNDTGQVEEFSSIDDARRRLNELIADTCYIVTTISSTQQNQPHTRIPELQPSNVQTEAEAEAEAETATEKCPNNPISPTKSAIQLKESCLANLQTWSEALDTYLLKASVSTIPSKDLRAATLLKIYYCTITLVLRVEHPTGIPVFTDDRYDTEFQKIITLTRALLSAEEDSSSSSSSLSSSQTKSSQPRTKTTFTSDLGIIIPLYVTVVHCKTLSLRLQAFTLLQKAAKGGRREGMWDAVQVTAVCERILAVECGEQVQLQLQLQTQTQPQPQFQLQSELQGQAPGQLAGQEQGKRQRQGEGHGYGQQSLWNEIQTEKRAEKLMAVRAVPVEGKGNGIESEYAVELDFGVSDQEFGDLVVRTENLNLVPD